VLGFAHMATIIGGDREKRKPDSAAGACGLTLRNGPCGQKKGGPEVDLGPATEGRIFFLFF